MGACASCNKICDIGSVRNVISKQHHTWAFSFTHRSRDLAPENTLGNSFDRMGSSEHALDNNEFIREVDRIRSTTSSDEFYRLVKTIVEDFVYPEGSRDINISDETRERIIHLYRIWRPELRKDLVDIFEVAEIEITAYLALNVFPRYINSSSDSGDHYV